jgi:phage shock protein C
MQNTARLARSRNDRMIAGVASGIARYLHIDPTIVRLIFVLLAFSGPAILFYPLLWVIMPEEPTTTPGAADPNDQVFVATGETQRLRIDPMTGAPGEPEQEVPIHNLGGDTPSTPGAKGRGSTVIGFLLVGLGTFITLQMIWPGFASFLFPAALIVAGVWLLRRS